MNIILLPFNLLCLHMHLETRTLHRPHNTFLRSHLSPDSTLPAFVVSTPHTPAQRTIARSTSISPTRQQAVEANRCNARTASLETSYDHRTPSICTCLSPCLACNRPPRQTAVEAKKSNARAYQCLWQRTATPWYHDTIIPQCCHKFPQSPLPMNPASAMTKERVTTNSTATNRWKQTVVQNTDKRWPCAVYFVYVWNDCKVLNVTWQRLT